MISIYGATGSQGRALSQRLADAKLPIQVVGRNEPRLRELAESLQCDHKVALAHDFESLTRAFAGSTLTIIAASPLSRIGDPLLCATIKAGSHYLDISGEQSFVRDVHERFDAVARREKCLILTGFRGDIVLADWMAHHVASSFNGEHLDAIHVGVALQEFQNKDMATRHILDQARQPSCVWQDDRWNDSPPMAMVKTTRFPLPLGDRESFSFPMPTTITIPKHIKARLVQSYLALWQDVPWINFAAALAPWLAPMVPSFLKSPLGYWADGQSRVHSALDQQPKADGFSMVVEGELNSEHRSIAIEGFDLNKASAETTAMIAEQLLSSNTDLFGVLAPSEWNGSADNLSKACNALNFTLHNEGLN